MSAAEPPPHPPQYSPDMPDASKIAMVLVPVVVVLVTLAFAVRIIGHLFATTMQFVSLFAPVILLVVAIASINSVMMENCLVDGRYVCRLDLAQNVLYFANAAMRLVTSSPFRALLDLAGVSNETLLHWTIRFFGHPQ